MSSEPIPAPSPEDPDETLSPLKLAAATELSLYSFMELARTMTGSMDRYAILDHGLFHLMGQLGIARAAFWVVDGEASGALVLLRSHGMRNVRVRALGTACGSVLLERASSGPNKLLSRDDVIDTLGDVGGRILDEAGIAAFAPIVSQGEIVGLVGLGPRINGKPFGSVDKQMIEGSLAVLSVGLENTRLYCDLVEQHRQLRLINENLTELDKLKSEFLQNVNHELRTPITIIQAYLNVLMEEEKEESQKREFLLTISEQSDRLQSLLESLLDFSNLARGGVNIDMQFSDVAGFLRTYHGDRAPGVAQGFREFVLEVADDERKANYDREALRKILDALIDNAIKFTSPGSRITLRLHTHEADVVVVEIEDDGPGIPPNQISHLFDSFRQGDGSSTRSIGGMGVGLSLASRFAEEMGGELTVNSEVGQGSRFGVVLTCTDPD